MTTTLNFKDVIDLPQWRPCAPAITASAAALSICSDLRNNSDQNPNLFYLSSASSIQAYNTSNDGWNQLTSPAMSSGSAAGTAVVFSPSQGPRGTLAAGSTSNSVILSTALPAAVGANQMANRGDGVGYKLRIIDNGTGGSGKIFEGTILNNTSGTTPTITFTSAIGFTPVTGSSYEFLSGRVFILGSGTTAAGWWKYYDVLTNSASGNLATTNLSGTIAVDTTLIALSELHVPYNQTPGQGFLQPITATAYTSGTPSITAGALPAGGVSSGTVTANQFRNFQVRITQDTTNVTAVGQRRRIVSHTSGTTPIFTLASAFTTAPSNTCTFVVENDDDKIICWTSGSTNSYNYNIGNTFANGSGTANTWDTTTWATAVANAAGNVAFQAFGIVPDSQLSVNNGMIYRVRGGGTANIDVFDITNGTTGTWSNAITYGGSTGLFNTGTNGGYDAATNQGRYMYLNMSGLVNNYRFDMLNRVLEPWAALRYPQGTAKVGNTGAGIQTFIDGTTKLTFWYQMIQTSANMFAIAIQR